MAVPNGMHECKRGYEGILEQVLVTSGNLHLAVASYPGV